MTAATIRLLKSTIAILTARIERLGALLEDPTTHEASVFCFSSGLCVGLGPDNAPIPANVENAERIRDHGGDMPLPVIRDGTGEAAVLLPMPRAIREAIRGAQVARDLLAQQLADLEPDPLGLTVAERADYDATTRPEIPPSAESDQGK